MAPTGWPGWVWRAECSALGVDDPAERLAVTAHHRGAVVGGDDRPLERARVRGEGGQPVVAVRGVAGQVDAGLTGLLGAGDVPRLEPEPAEDLPQLHGGRRVV